MNKPLFKALTILVALAGIVSLTASCEKFGFSRQIQFNIATASLDASADTKTAYSGVVDGGKERINWAVDDEIRIYSDKATCGGNDYCDYTVSSVNPDGSFSKADVSPNTGDGLEWGSGDHHFWGIYPPHAVSAPTVTGLSIPAAQDVSDGRKTETSELVKFAPDMSSAWMLADAAGITEGKSDELSLLFYPAFTAFEFTLASQFDKTITVNSFKLSSSDTDIAGTFNASIAAAGASSYSGWSSGSRDITVNFGTGVDVTQSKSLSFTVLALPRDIPNLTISFALVVDGNPITRTLALKTVSPDAFITFTACHKHKISGLALPSGDLKLTSIVVNDWVEGPAVYNYYSPVTPVLKCLSGEKYRRYDTDGVYTNWDGSYIVVSYGYENPSDEIIITDDPAGFQIEENTLLRPHYAPILELATNSDPANVLQLQLDNPHFKFIQYGNVGGLPTGGIDLAVRDHTKTDHLDVVSGSGVKTFFSVVPVEQFAIDADIALKTCRVSLLSVSPGILHEIPFNMTEGGSPVQALPGENMNELKFMYFGPAVFNSIGNEVVTP